MSLKQAVPWLAVLLLIGCGEPTPVETGIDLETPIRDLPGWEDVKREIGEPLESTRLETYLEFFREALDSTRRDPDPVQRQMGEDGWWDAAEQSLTSMVGAENAQVVLRWMESTWGRWTGGAP